MGEGSRRSGYMPLSGAASGRPLMINLVSRIGHRQILLATSTRPKFNISAAHVHFHATRGHNLGLTFVLSLHDKCSRRSAAASIAATFLVHPSSAITLVLPLSRLGSM
jgi:hypothetical protein